MIIESPQKRASTYATRHSISLEHRLGYGKDGIVLQTSRATAVKVFENQPAFERELACYRRLRERKIEQIRGFVIPGIIGWDAELLAIEMQIVTPPYLLDFADAYLDAAPQFPDEVMEQWFTEKAEEFGSRWPEVQLLLAHLIGEAGIHMLDVKIGNVAFAD